MLSLSLFKKERIRKALREKNEQQKMFTLRLFYNLQQLSIMSRMEQSCPEIQNELKSPIFEAVTSYIDFLLIYLF